MNIFGDWSGKALAAVALSVAFVWPSVNPVTANATVDAPGIHDFVPGSINCTGEISEVLGGKRIVEFSAGTRFQHDGKIMFAEVIDGEVVQIKPKELPLLSTGVGANTTFGGIGTPVVHVNGVPQGQTGSSVVFTLVDPAPDRRFGIFTSWKYSTTWQPLLEWDADDVQACSKEATFAV